MKTFSEFLQEHDPELYEGWKGWLGGAALGAAGALGAASMMPKQQADEIKNKKGFLPDDD